MSKKVIVFDFDGTIADIVDLFVDIINHLSIHFGHKKIKKEEKEKIRNKKTQEVFRHIEVSLSKVPFLFKEVCKEFGKEIEFLEPIEGIEEVLLKLKNDGYKLGILTSNLEDNVRKFLKKNNLDLFDFIYSESSFFGKDKTMRDLLKDQRLNSSEIVYIGDETRDIDAAKKVGVKIIAVTWGFNLEEILKKHSPDILVNRPEKLAKIIESL